MKGNNIVLVGFMGTGKTVVGKKLADKLGYKYIDSDEIIEKLAGKDIPGIFRDDGEEHFRQLEQEAISSVVALNHHVIATGGGAVIFKDNMENMKRAGLVVCLSARAEVIYERTKTNTYRPLLQVSNPLKKIKQLLEFRAPFYAKADLTIDTSDLSIDGIVDRIMAEVKRRQLLK